MDQDTARLSAVIEGQVQGVGFRAFVQSKAELLGLTGWVRNTSSGAVEVTAEGPHAALEDFLLYLRRGPRSAFVTQVQIDWLPASGEFESFTIERTFYR